MLHCVCDTRTSCLHVTGDAHQAIVAHREELRISEKWDDLSAQLKARRFLGLGQCMCMCTCMWMCVCMCIVCVDVHVDVHVHVHACAYVHVDVHVSMNTLFV